MPLPPEQLVADLLEKVTKWGYAEISNYLQLDLATARAVSDLFVSNPLHPLLQNNAVVLTIAELVNHDELGITKQQKTALLEVLGRLGITYNYAFYGLGHIQTIEG